MVLSLIILINENKENEHFKQWFVKHSKVAALVTVFGGTNMEALKLLDSNIFKLKMFSAPISDNAKNLILLGCVASSLIEDLPQLVISVCILSIINIFCFFQNNDNN
jgi:hypothetical protein